MANDLFKTPMDGVAPVIKPTTPKVYRSTASTAPESGTEYEGKLLSWVLLAVREAETMLALESEAEDVDENIRIVLNDEKQKPVPQSFQANSPNYRNNYSFNRLGKNVNDLASAITDFKPIGQFKTFNTLYEGQAGILDNLMTAWWYNNDIDLKLQMLSKQSLVCRTAYAHVVFNPTLHHGMGDLDLVVLDYRDVLPIRPNSKASIQDAVGIIIKRKNTVNWGRSRYPDKATEIHANSEGGVAASWAQRSGTSSPALDHLQRSIPKKQADFAIPTYDHYEIYVKDGSINKSNSRKWVGPGPEGENAWGYWVEPNDQLYPRGRLIVISNLNTVLFDGGNPYWHGMFPVIKMTLDPWPMTFLGKSALVDAKPAYKLHNEMLQGMVAACRKALKPGIIADRSTMNRQVLDKFDSSEPGWKLRTNPSGGQGIIIEPPPVIPAYVEGQMLKAQEHMDHVMGILDMRALAQLKSLNESMDVESLLENLGPSVRTKGRIIEIFLRELGTMMRANFFQFYTVERRVEILGADGMDFEDFDFDPGSLIPAFTPDQFMDSFGGKADAQMARFGGSKSRAERAQEHIKSFTYFITANSLLSLAKTQDKLMYLQLFRMNVIDAITLLEKLDVPNIGELPGNPKTIVERMGAAAQSGMVGAVSAAGRKATAQQMPEMRSDGRISESG